MNGELGACGRAMLPVDRIVDTLQIARTKHPGAKHTLDALCVRYGVDLSARELHGALLDAQLLAQVFIELTGGRQIALGLAVG
jgi:DNA polymerase-3 subunit epsilon